MSDKKQYRHKKTGKIAFFTDEQYKYVENGYEPVEGGEVTTTSAKKNDADPVEAELQKARQQYEDETGQKPGNRKLETLLQEIEEHRKGGK